MEESFFQIEPTDSKEELTKKVCLNLKAALIDVASLLLVAASSEENKHSSSKYEILCLETLSFCQKFLERAGKNY
jgi:hypothetical protein